MTNKEKISAVFFGKGSWTLFDESNQEWLMTSANEGDLQAACLLIHGMHHKYHCWIEKFVDEDTNEEVEFEHRDLVDGTTFEPDEEAEAQTASCSMPRPTVPNLCSMPFAKPSLILRLR